MLTKRINFTILNSNLQVSTVSNAPNRNEGIVSKAMEYIFGW